MQAKNRLHKKPRLPRIERDETMIAHEDENAHLWAVSYSDFLMALLSFFILFYSVDSSKRKMFIINLAKQFKEGSSNYGAHEGGGKIDERLPANFLESLKDLNVSVDKEKEILVVNFADDFFSPGKYEIRNDKQKTIQDLLARLKPFSKNVNLYFEGHADNSPLAIHKSDILVDNFVLSSLRASTALLIAKKAGFSEKTLFIQADSSNIRNSRSLSIRIEPKVETL